MHKKRPFYVYEEIKETWLGNYNGYSNMSLDKTQEKVFSMYTCRFR